MIKCHHFVTSNEMASRQRPLLVSNNRNTEMTIYPDTMNLLMEVYIPPMKYPCQKKKIEPDSDQVSRSAILSLACRPLEDP